MKTSKRTTYILLERDVEDIALLNDIRKFVARSGISSIKLFAHDYPKLCELMQALEYETKEQE